MSRQGDSSVAGHGSFFPKRFDVFNVLEPVEIPEDQMAFLVKHLQFSSAIKEMQCCAEAIIHGLYKSKSSKGTKVIRNQTIRNLIRGIRRFTKYELLRSSLEGLLFEQVPYLDEPIERCFKLEGNSNCLLLTHVYFSRCFWEFHTYEKEACFDKSDNLSEGDIMLVLGFLNNLESLLWSIKTFSDEYNGQDRLKWRRRLRSNIRGILKTHTTMKLSMINMLNSHLKDDEFYI